jgi:antitoxin HigA-1
MTKKQEQKLEPIHPGEILYEEFMLPLDLNANKLAIALRVPAPTVYGIVEKKRAISVDMALRLARYFSTTPEFWVNLQARYFLEIARDKKERQVEREIIPFEVGAAAR